MSAPQEDFVPYFRPDFGTEEEEAVLRVLRSGWLTTGPEALAFEREFSSYIGASHALAVNSATAGLHLAYEAAGLGPGKNLLTTPYTFTATAEAARYLGAEVYFADIEKDGFNLDPERAEDVLRRRSDIRAITVVHVGGHPCDMAAFRALACKYGCLLIEDAAHAFPVKTDLGWIGTLGDFGVFSFYANKTITTGEGGMIVTADETAAKRMGVMRIHGMDRPAWDRYTSARPSYHYEIVEPGFKYIGRAQLPKAQAYKEERAYVAQRYQAAFGCLDYLSPPKESAESSWHLYPLRLKLSRLSLTRDEFFARFTGAGIGASVHYIPLHLMPYWSKRYGLGAADFPESLARYESVVSLPIFQGMKDSQVDRVIQVVREISESALVEG
jgi:dTDP-4-amino-4,6-dideoxygalactose transaminase